jgi:hypothetical protein
MKSGSPTPDGGGWPSAQRPYWDEATSGPGPYGPGRRGDPQDGPGRRQEAPFGPEISWPNGFRQLDPESQRLLDVGYGPAGYGPEGYGSAGYAPEGYGYPGSGRGAYDGADPRYGGTPGYGEGYGYQQSAMDDFGYGDPGYSDPSYDGPRDGYGGSALPGGNRGGRAPGTAASADGAGYGRPSRHVPGFREPSRPEYGYPQGPPAGARGSYPLGGDQQGYPRGGADGIYPVTGAQEALPATGPQPRADVRAARDAGFPQADDVYAHWAGGSRLDSPAASDPRLEGMRYDELRYDDPPFGESGYDEPLDDDSWYEELRRSAPAYPQRPGGPSGMGQRPADLQRPADPRPSGYGQQPGFSPPPARERTSGYGQPSRDRGGLGPQMSAGRDARPSGPAGPQDLAVSGASYLGAPAAGVGLLTPPGITRLDPPADDRPSAAAGAGQLLAPQVRPGHGLDGPEITSSWPTRPQVGDPETFEDFWREDDDEAYRGLFPNEADVDDSGGKAARTASRGTGRRRGRSRDHRLWLALIGVVLVAAAAIGAILRFEFPSHSGPTHTLVTPARIGTYARTVDLEKQTHLAALRNEVITMSSGQASGVVSAVYESGNPAAGSVTRIIMFIGGHLANAAPATSITAFTEKFAGATVVPAGSLGGQAACVENGGKTSDPVSMCVWFDNDSFGEIVSPTMSASMLASAMQTIRPSVELVTKK